MNKISAVVLTKNEEKNIAKCIKSLKFADEIIVLDDYSTDNTAKIAHNDGAKVISSSLDGNFASQRNFAVKKAKNDWVLFVDADEIVTPQLGSEIVNAINRGEFESYYLLRKDVFNGKTLKGGEWGNAKIIRLVKKGSGEWKRKVHEHWITKGEVGTLHSPLLHFAHPSLVEFFQDINTYSTLHAKENVADGKNVNIFKICCFPVLKFIINYIFKRGYKDGVEGFIYSVIMSFHSFLSWSKMYTKSY